MLALTRLIGAVHHAKVCLILVVAPIRGMPPFDRPPVCLMALPPAAPTRRLKHRRSIDVQIFARDDGLWEVDARLIDVKTRDLPMAAGLRPAGTPLHEMLLRLVIDTRLNILAAGAQTFWMPYPGHCGAYEQADGSDVYARLVGLNLLKGFRAAVKERLGGIQGCTHITEMSQVLPTAVIQAFAGEVLDTREGSADGASPFQLDRCHALRSDGEVVRLHYPKWYRERPAGGSAQNPPPVER
jgi:hypothetical protein